MTDRRLLLDSKLSQIPGVEKTYYQPPESLKFKYPCIIYTESSPDIIRASNSVYLSFQPYDLTIIDKDRNSTIPEAIKKMFRYCKPGDPSPVDGQFHWQFTIYF